MNNLSKNQNNDEIDLIDFFAFLLRYRKRILTIVLSTIIIITAGYFIYSAWQDNNIETEREYETKMLISMTPGVRHLLSWQPGQSFIHFFIFHQIIQNVLEDTHQTSLRSNEVLQWIPLQISFMGDERNYESVNKKLSIKENVNGNVIEVTYKGNDPQSGIIFLQSLFLHGSIALDKYINPISISYIDTYESISLSAFESDNYVMIKSLADGKTNAVVKLFEPYVLELEQIIRNKGTAYSMLVMVIIFAAFLLSVVLAFCIKIIKKIKNDEEAMKKINTALRKE